MTGNIVWTKRRAAILGGTLLYMAVFVLALLLRPGTKAGYHAFFNVYQAIPPLFAGLVGLAQGLRGAGRLKAVRIGWALVGLGCLSFAVGQLIWTYLETIRGIEVPFPSLSDAGYLGTYPCLIAGVLLLSTNVQDRAGRARVFMDGAIAAGSAGVLSWHFLLARLWSKSDVTPLGKAIGVAYPLGDVACLFVALVALASVRGDRVNRRPFAFLACGMLLLTFADTVFTHQSLNASYETGSWNDWGWSFGWILIGFAPLVAAWTPTTQAASRNRTRIAEAVGDALRMFGPYAAALGAVALTLAHDFGEDARIELQTCVGALFVLGLIVVRQVFMVLENHALTRRVRGMNDDLERLVADRTHKLAALQNLTKRINSTLDAKEVEDCAVEETRRLLDAHAVFLGFDTAAPDSASTHHRIEVALLWQNETVGRIAVERDAPFQEDDVALLESVAVEIGAALKNSRRHAEALAAADRDSVTGLLNHRAIHQRLSRELLLAGTEGSHLSVIMMDMNNFKLFNDTYGHVVGDGVLKSVAERLAAVCGEVGQAARYGGDEFAVVLPKLDANAAERVAFAIKHALDEIDFMRQDDDRRIPIGLTYGIATFPEDGRNRHELLSTADRNLYGAKNSASGVGRTTRNQEINRELRTHVSFETLDILVDSIDNKDRYTRKHSEDVTEYSLWIAEELGLSEETMRTIRMTGLLHDVGKIGVPDEVLRKPGRLTDEEYETMKRHPKLGALIVGAIPGMEGIVDGVRSHHERWDGKGYPDALGSEDIPLLGRIVAVADAFSAMTTDRPYRKGMDREVALDRILEGAGTQFDPVLAEAFAHAVASRRAIMPGLDPIAA